jgi:methyl-accepting chemotaxis protein
MTHQWTFQKKVSAGFTVMVCLAALTAAVAVYALRAVVASKDRVMSVNAQNLIGAARWSTAVEQEIAGFRGFLLAGDERMIERRKAAMQDFEELSRSLEQSVYTDEGKHMLAEVKRSNDALMAAQDSIIAQRRSNVRLEVLAQEVERQAIPIHDSLIRQVEAVVDREQRLLQQARDESTANASRASTIVVSLAALAVLFAGLTAFFLSRALSRQIGSAVQHVQNSSAELQTTANQQATGAREAASAMNEVTTTMSELLVTSRQILESAQRVAHIAQETAGAARAGDDTVAKMQEAIAAIRRQVDVIVSHMLDLGKKSQQIGSILDIINELSEQTNILSINATIEAAGAGEAGKRFAVVGDEIRKLADRTGGSTKEIRGLVEEIRSAVNATVLATEGGSKAVDAGLRHFEEVTHGYKQITDLVGNTTEAAREIELGTKQQMTAVEQVNSAVGSAAQAARETETSTTQTLQTATQLAHLSHDLSQIVQPHAAAAAA